MLRGLFAIAVFRASNLGIGKHQQREGLALIVPGAGGEIARLAERPNGILPFSTPEIHFAPGFQNVRLHSWIGTAFITHKRAAGMILGLPRSEERRVGKE